jgi:transposase
MLDYKSIIIKHYALNMSGRSIAEEMGVSKSGVNDFLKAFKQCEKLSFPLPEGITNYGIAILVYGRTPEGMDGRNMSFELPDYAEVEKLMDTRKNMTLVFLWARYKNRCIAEEKKFYSYRQFCERYAVWCEENRETLHFNAVIGQKMEIDFAGKTFRLVDSITGEIMTIVVFVAVLPYSQYIYAEGMLSTKEPQWIDVNNHALQYFKGVPPIVVCDNCKQAVIANKDWIAPELNKDYADWAEHNATVIMPAKVRKPKYKSSVENAVGILEKGLFHDLEERTYFSLKQFNADLWGKLDELNTRNLKGKDYSRYDRWLEECKELMPLPSTSYQYMERKEAKVSSDFHVRFDNSYYSVSKEFVHRRVLIKATTTMVKIYSLSGELLSEWERAHHKGQWMTNPDHMPKNYKDLSSWNGPYFIQKSMSIGPNTCEVIRRVLKSRKYEVQTYRLCVGILSFSSRYGKTALEETCRQALELNKTTYTFIKNSIAAIAEEFLTDSDRIKLNDDKNKGAYVMSPAATDIQRLLSKSQSLIDKSQKEGDNDDDR